MKEHEWFGTEAHGYQDGFWHRYQVAFPGVAQWLREYSPDSAATVYGWFVATEFAPVEVLNEVLQQMQRGVLEVPAGYEREKTGLKLRYYAGVIIQAERERRAQQIAARAYTNAGDQQVTYPARDYFAVRCFYHAKAREIGLENLDAPEYDGAERLTPGGREAAWVTSQVIAAGLEPREHETRDSYRAKREAAGIPLVAGKIGGLKRVNDC